MSLRLSIELHAVSVRRGGRWALKDVSLALQAGEHWALIGANGSGKTQLLKLLAGQVWPTPTGREEILYRLGRRRIEPREAKARIAYLGGELQDKYARYGWNPTVRELLATGLHGTDLLLAEVTAGEARKVARTLRSCGLAALAERRFASLSYGQKRIALLARALCPQPDWLLLDEFYNGLDMRNRARIDRMLAAARAAGCAWVAAAHRAVDVPHGTRRQMELAAGHLVAVRTLRRALRSRSRVDPGEERSARGARQPLAAAAAPGGAPLIRLRRVDLYVDYRRVLRGVDWDLERGEHWAVFGANGAGKTSFLKLLYGDLSPALGGRIERDGCPLGAPISDWKRRVGYVSPELQTDHAVDVSVRELIASGRHASIGLAEPASAADAKVADRWLRFFDLLAYAEHRPRELSYGQLRRALIARALAAGPRLLLLDEPLTGLDPEQRASMKRLLQRLMARRITVVAAVHHKEDLPAGITHVLRLSGGRAIAENRHSAN